MIFQGTMTEKFLTLSDKEFSYLLRKNSDFETICKETKETYRYSKVRPIHLSLSTICSHICSRRIWS